MSTEAELKQKFINITTKKSDLIKNEYYELGGDRPLLQEFMDFIYDSFKTPEAKDAEAKRQFFLDVYQRNFLGKLFNLNTVEIPYESYIPPNELNISMLPDWNTLLDPKIHYNAACYQLLEKVRQRNSDFAKIILYIIPQGSLANFIFSIQSIVGNNIVLSSGANPDPSLESLYSFNVYINDNNTELLCIY